MASSGNLFLVLFILAAFSSSSTIAARDGKLFFSKYVHSFTTEQTPISQISSSPFSSPTPAPSPAPAPSPVSADESQSIPIAASALGAGKWGAGSGLVVPKQNLNTPYPTYKNDEELEEALNSDVDDSFYSPAEEENRDADGGSNGYRGQSSSSYGNEADRLSNGGKSVSDFVDEAADLVADNKDRFKFKNVDYSKKFRYGTNDDDNHGYSASAKPQYQYQSYNNGNKFGAGSYNGNEEKEDEFSGGNVDRLVDEGVSFAGNGNGEVERQGMSDTRFMAGGKYFHDVNQEENWP
ncbi:hypothetical protein LINGRAHAP2_LOCUS28063 [Linum grandiflorum]